jgi:hypothetical protein
LGQLFPKQIFAIDLRRPHRPPFRVMLRQLHIFAYLPGVTGWHVRAISGRAGQTTLDDVSHQKHSRLPLQLFWFGQLQFPLPQPFPLPQVRGLRQLHEPETLLLLLGAANTSMWWLSVVPEIH